MEREYCLGWDSVVVIVVSVAATTAAVVIVVLLLLLFTYHSLEHVWKPSVEPVAEQIHA